MNANLLKYLAFLKTVEYGSFTRAAEALNYSQSGISRMIHDLEQEWNLTLLTRSRSGVHLTAEGTQLLPYIKTLCGQFTQLQSKVDELNGLQSGLIRDPGPAKQSDPHRHLLQRRHPLAAQYHPGLSEGLPQYRLRAAVRRLYRD